MLIEGQIFKTGIARTNIEHYTRLGKKVKLDDVIFVRLEELPLRSAKKVKVKCDYCGDVYTKPYGSYTMSKENSLMKKDSCKHCYKKRIREAQKNDERFEYLNMLNDLRKTDSYKISETYLETKLIENIELVEKGMRFIDSQIQVEDGRIDILARDINGTLCIIELKVVDDCKELIFQCSYYPTQFSEKVRVITICPYYHRKIYKSLLNLGTVEMKAYRYVNDRIYICDFEDISYIAQ